MEQTYIVKLVSPLQGERLEEVSQAVAAHLGLTSSKAAALLSRGPGPLTKPVARPVAARVAEALRTAGADVELAQRNWDDFLLAQTSSGETANTDADNAFFLSDDEEWEAAWDEDWPDDTADTSPVTEPIADAHAGTEASSLKPRYSAFVIGLLLIILLAVAFIPGLRQWVGVGGSQIETATQASEIATTDSSSVDGTLEALETPEPQAADEPQAAEASDALSEASALDETAELATEDQPTPENAETPTGEPELTSAASDVAAAAATETTSIEADEASVVTDTSAQTTEVNQPEDLVAQLTERAEAGDAQAQLELGRRYASGDGVTADAESAFGWFERAAQGGNARAQYELGWLYANGTGVERDLAQAAHWYEEAAVGGEAEAQYQLGFYHYYGQGTPQNYQQARAWFSAAAEQGVAEARFRLGVMYLEGQGGQADANAARRWLQLASQQGVTEASSYLETIENSAQADASPASAPAPSSPAQANDEGASDELTVTGGEPVSEPELGETPTEPQPEAQPTPVAGSVTLAGRSAASETGGVVTASSTPQADTPPPLTEEDLSLFAAARTEDAATIAETIRAGANVNARDDFGQTPLMYAAANNTPNAIAELIVDLADVNAQSYAGWSALMYAARDNPGVVEALLVRGADPDLVNAEGETALDIARAAKAELAIDLLSPEPVTPSAPPTTESESTSTDAVPAEALSEPANVTESSDD